MRTKDVWVFLNYTYRRQKFRGTEPKIINLMDKKAPMIVFIETLIFYS